jgi:hypothetical protein
MWGAIIENIEDQFNSCQYKILLVHIEELQNENNQNHNFETAVKQLTTKESSSRAIIVKHNNQPIKQYGVVIQINQTYMV